MLVGGLTTQAETGSELQVAARPVFSNSPACMAPRIQLNTARRYYLGPGVGCMWGPHAKQKHLRSKQCVVCPTVFVQVP